jgi:hypothetical protein
VIAVACLALTACDRHHVDPGASPQLLLRFDESGSFASNSGNAAVDVHVVAVSGGEVRQLPNGSGYALGLPAYNPAAQPPRAGLVVTDAGGQDDLDPGDAPFSFGADIRLDLTSEGSVADNGNNILQRGLHEDLTQFKLQADQDTPSCTVKGDQGEVAVASSRKIEPLAWYAVTCHRTADALSITVTRKSDGSTWTDHAERPTGSVDTTDQQPLSIGVKVGPTARITASADEFNGDIDNAFVQIGD